MTTKHFLFTSESVTEGHPDKICDQISDAILDAFLSKDPKARVAAETAVSTGLILLVGEVSTNCYVDVNNVARRTVEEIGYKGYASGGFDAHSSAILNSFDEQSSDIAGGVDNALETRSALSSDDIDKIGAGDQGLMFGYACNETPELMPLPIALAHRLVQQLAAVRKDGTCNYLRPDGKSQVTVEYVDGKPARIDTIVISTQHNPEVNGQHTNDGVLRELESDMKAKVIDIVFRDYDIKPDANTKYFINPSGRFVIGGPQGDAGLTGRKIIVDTYGGYARHGGGAFSGKDPTKVDRSAAYATRWVAKNIVAAGLAEQCEIQVSYAIGVAKPVSIHVDTFGTGLLDDEQLVGLVNQHFDLRPAAIIQNFDLTGLPAKHNGRFYQRLAAYGHMGRTDFDVPWERLEKVDQLIKAAEALGAKPKKNQRVREVALA
ncbi:MAG: methionine adenosyltransferase [Cyanobacteria bacterium HKST-UBA04]|nr:methionine adenosyltransferase [Cyanobacteria bacterium HKST-UBA04]MCA9841912.1 methionine adenosyltransferase [Cyanobacteria bacterium HKST-UBA03]